MQLSARLATPDDAEYLAPRLREEDAAECVAQGLDALDALYLGVAASLLPLTVLGPEDEPLAMMGDVPSTDISAAIWLLGTPLVSRRHALSFVKGTAPALAGYQQRWPVLFNVVDERNTIHIRWLKRAGFTFIMRHPFWGVERRPFLEFVRTAEPQE